MLYKDESDKKSPLLNERATNKTSIYVRLIHRMNRHLSQVVRL